MNPLTIVNLVVSLVVVSLAIVGTAIPLLVVHWNGWWHSLLYWLTYGGALAVAYIVNYVAEQVKKWAQGK